MIAVVGIHYRNYTHYTLCRSCLLIYDIAIVRSLSFSFLDDFEENFNISVAVKSDYMVFQSEILIYSLAEAVFNAKIPHVYYFQGIQFGLFWYILLLLHGCTSRSSKLLLFQVL